MDEVTTSQTRELLASSGIIASTGLYCTSAVLYVWVGIMQRTAASRKVAGGAWSLSNPNPKMQHIRLFKVQVLFFVVYWLCEEQNVAPVLCQGMLHLFLPVIRGLLMDLPTSLWSSGFKWLITLLWYFVRTSRVFTVRPVSPVPFAEGLAAVRLAHLGWLAMFMFTF